MCNQKSFEFIVLNEHHIHDRSKIYTRAQGPSKNMELHQSKKEQECNNKVPVVIICGPFKKYGTPPVKEGTRMQ
jgi:hypothetical protein